MATTNRELFPRMNSWDQAIDQSVGYEDSTLINYYVESIRRNPPWENPDPLHFSQRELELSCAFQRVLLDDPFSSALPASFRVLDVGGGNGYLGATIRRMLPNISWDWTVIESKSCASAYSQFQSAANIIWTSSEQHDWSVSSDINLVSCALQYLEHPDQELIKIANCCKYLVLMRLPLLDSPDHILTKQTFHDGLHPVPTSSWPHWFLSRTRLHATISTIGDIIYQWTTLSESYLFEGTMIPLEGMLIKTFYSPT